MKRRAVVTLAILFVVSLGAGAAWAAWLSAGSGSASATARSMPAGNQPSTSATGRSVTVSWAQSSFAGDGAVAGYLVKRYTSPGSVLQTIGANCSGTIAALSCVESNVPDGAWAYSVTPKQQSWTGSESAMSAALTIDLTPPTIDRSVIVETGLNTGFVGQGESYVVYANVSDGGTLGSVTADVTNITSGSTAVAMTSSGGPFSVGTTTYSHKTASLTASTPLTEGVKSYSITATDSASNQTTQSFSVTVDNSAPTPSDVQTTNGTGTNGLPDSGDKMILTYSEAMDPGTILSGWNGSTTENVQLKITDGGSGSGSTDDIATVLNSGGTATLNLGQVDLGSKKYAVGANVIFNATITLTGGGTTVTVTLGTVASGTASTDNAKPRMSWAPSNAATDLAGRGCSTTARLEVEPPSDTDF